MGKFSTIVCGFLFAWTAIACAATQTMNDVETIDISLPKGGNADWVLKFEKANDGKSSRIWTRKVFDDEDEKVVITSVPFKTRDLSTIQDVVNNILQPIKNAPNIKWKIYELGPDGAIVGWKEEGSLVAILRVFFTDSTLHTVWYSFKGRDTTKVDTEKWVGILKSAQLKKDKN